MEKITSADNKKIKYAVKLRTSPRERKLSHSFFCEGARLCYDAYLSNLQIECAFTTEKYAEKFPTEFAKITAAAQNSCTVSQMVMEKLCDTVNPQGAALVVKTPENVYTAEDGLYVALENTQDPANLGAIARTAEAFGAVGIIISADGCDPFSQKSLRASMGAFFRIPVIITQDFISELSRFRAEGAKIFASVPDVSATPLPKVLPPKKSVLVIGNEGNGITLEVSACADEKITIPMWGRAESLNASAAAAVMIYELTKNRE